MKTPTNNTHPSLIAIEKELKSHPFIAPTWFQNPHMQTVISAVVPQMTLKRIPVQRRFISVPDGSKLAADCSLQKDHTNTPTVIVLSGFEGYMQTTVSRFGSGMRAKLYKAGYNVIHLRQRGEGDTIHLTKSIGYMPDDLPIAFEQIASWGHNPMYVIAFSAGAYNLLFALGKIGDNARKYLRGTVAVSAPLTTEETWEHIDKNPVYNWLFLKGYKYLILRRAKVDPPGTWDIEKLKQVKDKKEWADAFIHKWGHADKITNYEQLNVLTDALPLVPSIKVPSLIIHAKDDPISPAAPFMRSLVQENPYIIPFLTDYGGHCGFIMTEKRYGDSDRHWAQNRALEFITLLEAKR